MRELIRDRLWIGNAADVRDIGCVLSQGIVAIIDLAMDEPPVQFPRDIIYCRFPLVDGGENSAVVIHAAIQTTQTLVQGGFLTLVACRAGMSRSPAIAAAVVALLQHILPDAALKQITLDGAYDVSPTLWADVKAVLANCRPK
jgi:hypothetical protein